MKKIFIFLICISSAAAQSCTPLLVPDYLKIQFAGSIGFLSAGPGWHIFNKKIHTELMFGFTPVKFQNDLYNLTWKINYHPFALQLNEKVSSSVIYAGIYFSKTFGEKYWDFLPDRYERLYYYHTPGLRKGIYLGTNIQSIIRHDCQSQAELFFECSSYDLLLVSYWPNKSTLPLSDILKLALGVRLDF